MSFLDYITNNRLTEIEHKLDAILSYLKGLVMTLDELKTKVDGLSTVEDSVVALLNGISQQLRDAKNDPAKIQALADQLDAQKQKLADAVTANTPSA